MKLLKLLTIFFIINSYFAFGILELNTKVTKNNLPATEQDTFSAGDRFGLNYSVRNTGNTINALVNVSVAYPNSNIFNDITNHIVCQLNNQYAQSCCDYNERNEPLPRVECQIKNDVTIHPNPLDTPRYEGELFYYPFNGREPEGTYQIKTALKNRNNENIVTPSVVRARKTSLSTCLEIDSNNNDLNDGENRINLIIVGLNYASLEDLAEVAESIIGLDNRENGLFSTEPFKSNRNRFNLLLVDDIRNVQINTFPIGSQEEFNFKENLANIVRSVGLKCPYQNKRIIGVINTEPTGNLLDFAYPNELGMLIIPYRSSIVLNDLEAYNILHEIGGHSIAGLYDEYQWQVWLPEPEDMEGQSWINQCFYVSQSQLSCRFEYGGYSCDTPSQVVIDRCNREAPWHDLVGNGCGQEGIIDCDRSDPNDRFEIKCTFGGCSPNSFVSSRYNVMAISSGQKKYSEYHQRLICRKVKDAVGSVGGVCNKLCLNGCANGQKCINGVCVSNI